MLYAISNGNVDLIKRVMEKYGYKRSDEVKKVHYDKIALEIEAEMGEAMKGADISRTQIQHL